MNVHITMIHHKHGTNVYANATEEGATHTLATYCREMTWANWCSKLRVDEFSGGAVAVYKGNVKWVHPSRVLSKWLNRRTRS